MDEAGGWGLDITTGCEALLHGLVRLHNEVHQLAPRAKENAQDGSTASRQGMKSHEDRVHLEVQSRKDSKNTTTYLVNQRYSLDLARRCYSSVNITPGL